MSRDEMTKGTKATADPLRGLKVFLTGGSGELGRPTVRMLVRDGHEAVCSSRSEASDRIIADLGGTPMRVDLLNGRAVRQAVADADTVLHLATAIPPSANMGDLSTWVTNDRLREETTAHLADAVVANGSKSLVLQSYFGVRASGDDRWISEAPDREPRWSGIGVMDSMRKAEEAVRGLGDRGAAGVILRFGSLYSPTSEQLQAQVRFLRAGAASIPGDGSNYWPYVATEDAASAVVSSLPLGNGAYDVSDDDPVTLEVFWTMAAQALELPTPPKSPASGPMADILLGSWRVSNRVFVDASGWKPLLPSVLVGWPQAVRRYLSEMPGLRPV